MVGRTPHADPAGVRLTGLQLGQRLLALATLGSTAVLVLRPALPAGPELVSNTVLAGVSLLLIGLAIALGLWRSAGAQRRGASRVARGVLCGLAVVYGGMALSRITVWQYESSSSELRLRRLATNTEEYATGLAPIDGAEWALRLALHAAADSASIGAVPGIPREWPYPTGVALAVGRQGIGVSVLWSRTESPGGPVVCHAVTSAIAPGVTAAELTPSCTIGVNAPAELAFAEPARQPELVVRQPDAPMTTPWPQHRVDALRRGAVEESAPSTAGTGWHTETHTPVRASASIVGDLVLVGGHGTGMITALDRGNGAVRWAARAPNWIHQEPISDGRIAVVGFGDNRRSFEGRAPSGVAAYSLATGRRLWTRFDESSVMTSPVIQDSVLIYVSADGRVRKRLLSTGRLIEQLDLSGEVPMGPPVLRGDTLIVTLEADQVCALQTSALQVLWCQHVWGQRMLGHSSAALDGNRVLLSGVATAVSPSLGEFFQLPIQLQARLLKAILFPQFGDYNTAAFAGQRFTALDLATGRVEWTSDLFATRRLVDGHTAGTPVVQGDVGVVALPVSDTVVGFDTRSGNVLWTSGGHRARGPALIVDDRVIVAGRDGVIQVRDFRTGELTCTIKRQIGHDRAGPAAGDGLVFFANLEGQVEAIPRVALLSCMGNRATPPTGSTE